MSEIRKLEDDSKKNKNESSPQNSQLSSRAGGDTSRTKNLGQLTFRNNLERMHHLYDEEKVENINDT